MGYKAAELLDRMLKGEALRAETVMVDPERLVVRQSSDVLAVKDPSVASAVRFIREHTGSNIGVEDVLQEVPIARRTLEQRFRRVLGCSIHDEITHSRMLRAKKFLIETEVPLIEIAEQCGFNDRSRFGKVFRKETKYSPAVYRRTFKKPS